MKWVSDFWYPLNNTKTGFKFLDQNVWSNSKVNDGSQYSNSAAKMKPADSCFSFKIEPDRMNSPNFNVTMERKYSRRDSCNSDCEKKKAMVKKIPCFVRKPSRRISSLIPIAAKIRRSNSLEIVNHLEKLDNLSEVSNQSTCSQKSFQDCKSPHFTPLADYFYQDPSKFPNCELRKHNTFNNGQNGFLKYASVHQKLNNSHDAIKANFAQNEGGSSQMTPLNRWIPDEYSKKCMKCKREFDFFTRKHHCRRCGLLLCFSCCGNWMRIKDLFKVDITKEQKKALQDINPQFNRMSRKKQKVRICNDWTKYIENSSSGNP